ncbi:hypothetical protein Hamer_G005827 [Homarus americanus]|uniref:Uncharacterized protein n=1 Tax=Homarus americanus TaxID=6706 RepID=A0A8J5JQL3_HOMAM|nr:hypothetical protein Hamer_G005827 [Homarus americanus]
MYNVLGPGGIPKSAARQIPAGRHFTPDQAPIRGRGRKRLRNVLTRMEEMTGPLAVLRTCQQKDIRIKVRFIKWGDPLVPLLTPPHPTLPYPIPLHPIPPDPTPPPQSLVKKNRGGGEEDCDKGEEESVKEE